jgi:hypothetical protein
MILFIEYIVCVALLFFCVLMFIWSMDIGVSDPPAEEWDDKYGNRHISMTDSNGEIDWIECRDLKRNVNR